MFATHDKPSTQQRIDSFKKMCAHCKVRSLVHETLYQCENCGIQNKYLLFKNVDTVEYFDQFLTKCPVIFSGSIDLLPEKYLKYTAPSDEYQLPIYIVDDSDQYLEPPKDFAGICICARKDNIKDVLNRLSETCFSPTNQFMCVNFTTE